jgi:hypothetical protein
VGVAGPDSSVEDITFPGDMSIMEPSRLSKNNISRLCNFCEREDKINLQLQGQIFGTTLRTLSLKHV